MKKKLLNELKLKAMNDEAEASASLASHNYHYGVHETVAFKEGQESERTQIMEWAKENSWNCADRLSPENVVDVDKLIKFIEQQDEK